MTYPSTGLGPARAPQLRKDRDIPRLYSEPLDSDGIVPVRFQKALVISFPILEIIQRCLYRLPINGNLDTVISLITLYRIAQPTWDMARSFFIRFATSSVSIAEHDPVAKEVMAWMSANVISKSHTTRAFIDYEMKDRNAMTQQNPDEVSCLPSFGSRLFWVGFRPFLFTRIGNSAHRRKNSKHSLNQADSHHVDSNYLLQNEVTIATLGWNLSPIQDFIKTCHAQKLQNDAEMTLKATRKLDTIDMDTTIKDKLVKDAEYYYSSECKDFFSQCGIPYRRGYLFYGPPGTGKTSFSAALAGHLGCNMYLINLASGDINDSRLHRMFLSLPRKCVVVIEDIDAAGIDREQDTETRPGKPRLKQTLVTLSGLLNAIDGNASAEGRLLIMTSNHPQQLDEALTRPGRVDQMFYFGCLTHEAICSIFMRLIGHNALKRGTHTTEEIKFATEIFAQKIPHNTFTPAEVQNFLQSCRGDIGLALGNADDWVKGQLKKRANSRRTGSEIPPRGYISFENYNSSSDNDSSGRNEPSGSNNTSGCDNLSGREGIEKGGDHADISAHTTPPEDSTDEKQLQSNQSTSLSSGSS
ncbi:P-loop containing nucleoside triphosphate hydrolase protein [Corynespora cassiicola Philippines]|uniref:P-loop containing nucleoside triphosphate hydrolase protein n=1 Tax=Corynespora cassiicola Philippines TaxID=1448308 RepID=A0A2T2NFQ8_CORCC|nr:P-loop containing nucleoside triphosphate hydrolase protein [Corynespora cassiicola Philippines]